MREIKILNKWRIIGCSRIEKTQYYEDGNSAQNDLEISYNLNQNSNGFLKNTGWTADFTIYLEMQSP